MAFFQSGCLTCPARLFSISIFLSRIEGRNHSFQHGRWCKVHHLNDNQVQLMVERGVKQDEFADARARVFPFAFFNRHELDPYLSPGHQVDGGSPADIFVGRSAIRWLRLYG
jgi:hypothetical protein